MNPLTLESCVRAGNMADRAVAQLQAAGVNDALVVVFMNGLITDPVAIRNSDSQRDGFGSNSLSAYSHYSKLFEANQQQALYAARTGWRTAGQQLGVLNDRGRDEGSYLLEGEPGLLPEWAVDHKAGFTLTIASTEKMLTPEKRVEIAERAISDLDGDMRMPDTLAVMMLWNCIGNMMPNLDRDKLAVTLLMLPGMTSYVESFKPVVTCSQSYGNSAPFNWGVVVAKGRSVVISGEPSNPKSRSRLSRIVGGVPIHVDGVGEMVMAAGGLSDMHKDADAINMTLAYYYQMHGTKPLGKLEGIRS